jgi:hypothetical protein
LIPTDVHAVAIEERSNESIQFKPFLCSLADPVLLFPYAAG